MDLVHMAESPLYSAYRWLGRQLGRDVSLPEFAKVVDGLVEQHVLRLSSIDLDTEVRTQLTSVPADLESRYEAFQHTDPQFDPLGLSLTLGPAATPEATPAWEADLDFRIAGSIAERGTGRSDGNSPGS